LLVLSKPDQIEMAMFRKMVLICKELTSHIAVLGGGLNGNFT
jgi:hypothetical protein